MSHSSQNLADTSLPAWPHAWGEPLGSARLRNRPEDFRVDEVLGFEADGEGEHLLLQVQKRNRNTDQVARELARHAGIRARDVSYCGLKDRVAVTTQWFSLWLPGKADPDWSALENEELKILGHARHRRKLPRGALQANRFVIVLREVDAKPDTLEARLRVISQQGVPNYFGEQRFGRDGDNLHKAQAMFAGRRIKDRHLRGLYLSAARAYVFNQLLASRVAGDNWNQLLPGEACMLSGSRSFFLAEEIDETLCERLASFDISPSAPLWGRGELPSALQARAREEQAVLAEQDFCEGLEKAGMKQERRALILKPEDMSWRWPEANSLELSFALPAGAYATALLRELINWE